MYESNCLLQMSRNGTPFQGPLICDGNIHRFSRDTKQTNPDEWYFSYTGLLHSGQCYLYCRYGFWSEGSEFEYKSWEESYNKISCLSAIEHKELQAKIEENRCLVLIEEWKRHEEAAEKDGLRTRKGRKVGKSQVDSILKNPFYCGTMKTKYGLAEHHYKPLISTGLYQQART